MKKSCFVLTIAIVLINGVVLQGVAHAATQDHQNMQMPQQPTAQQNHQHMQMGKKLKVGKKGEITLTEPTTLDGIVLQPDTYVIQHRVAGGEHYVRFIELKQAEGVSAEGYYTYTEQDKIGEVKCRIEPAERAKATSAYVVIENGVPKITKVAIKGENVVHVF